MQPSQTDLILNSKGRIYHLDLHPDEIANTIITVGDPERVGIISQRFDAIELKRQHREFITHTGFYQNKRLTVLSTGIGTGNIDIVLNELDVLANYDFQKQTFKKVPTSLQIVRLGTTGGLQPHIPLDGFVVSGHAIGLDGLLHFYQTSPSEEEQALTKALHIHTNGLLPVKPYIASGAHQLVQLFEKDCFLGITMTCPGFYGPQARHLRGPLAYPNWIEHLQSFSFADLSITNFEMETAAIYGMGRLLGHLACSVNLVVANRVTQQFSTRISERIEQLADLVLNKLVSCA